MTFLNQIALSGIRASQVALNTTGQNVANVNTPGYSRLTTVTHSLSGRGGLSVGAGVEVSEIRRMASEFSTQQLWRATTAQHYYSHRQDYLTALEGLMAGDGSSISVGLDQFFAAVSEATATPNSIALRQQVIAEAANLAQRFNGLSSNIDAQVSALKEQRVAMANEINGLTANIAKLNKQIVETESVNGDTATLRDHRDALIQDLSKFASLRVDEDADGAYSVSLANGQPLVSGSSSGKLHVAETITGEQEVSLQFIDTYFPLRQDIFGGAFGGLHDVETNELRPMMASLHEMASQLSQKVNDVFNTGFDLNGNAGASLFSYDPNSRTHLLTVNGLRPEELAFSSAAGETGNNEVLLNLLAIKNETITVNGSAVSFNDAYTSLLGTVASNSRQNKADLESSTTVTIQAQAQRDSISAVSLDEEAVNLMAYQQAYQANMKVITTANALFDSVLAAF